jgi:methylated-DNA-[protein]-cysteine S-methyltransferase
MMEIYKAYHHSALGLLEIIGTAQTIKSVEFIEPEQMVESQPLSDSSAAGKACLAQLDEYFRGERREFSLNLDPTGTEFQKSVWQELLKIPYGKTVSYLNIAQALNNEKAIRAVGAANGQNPIVIIVPCHRVIGSDGKLTGYGGGLWRKEWLLKHEGVLASTQLTLF